MKTLGEQVFVDYLNTLSVPFEYEPAIGRRPPDFLVHAPSGDVICEVKDLSIRDEDREALEAVAAGAKTFLNQELPFHRIQLRLRAASKQLREYKAQYPCLVVLFDASGLVTLLDVTVLGAMYGETLISVPLDVAGTGASTQLTTVFDPQNRYLTPTSNTTISAVAILDHVEPNRQMLFDALSEAGLTRGTDFTTEQIKFIYEFGEQHPEVFARVPRIQLFDNVYAASRWPREALSGPHDEFWPRSRP